MKFKFSRLVVCFSIERLIAVYFPLKLITICSRLKTKLAITCLFIFSLSFYSFSLVTSQLEINYETKEINCVTSFEWFHFVSIMTIIDIITVTLLPFILITIINILIAYKIKKQSRGNLVSNSKNKKKKEKRQPSLLVSNSSRKYKTEISLCHINNTNLANKSIGRNTVRVNNNTNRTLFLISIVFLILHFPLAVNKSWYFFDGNYNLIEKENIELTGNYSEYFGNDTLMEETDLKQKLTLNEYEEIFERISCYLFYLNFSLNFFLYTSNKSKRKIFLNTLRKRFSF